MNKFIQDKMQFDPSRIAQPYTVTADGQVIDGPCWVVGVQTNAAGTSSTLDLYNGTANTDTPVMKGVPTGTINVAGYQRQIAPNGAAVYCKNGLYADVGGTGSPSFTVYAMPAF
jgi:hypothetical protein